MDYGQTSRCPHGVPWVYRLDVPDEDWHGMTDEERALCHAHLGHHCDYTPRLDELDPDSRAVIEALIVAERATSSREGSVTG